MPRGGTRPGAGRKRGPGKKNRELYEAVAATGIMPKDLMLRNMRYFDDEAQREIKRQMRKAVAARDWTRAETLLGRAHGCAVDAAPYWHHRLASLSLPDAPKPGEVQLEDMILASFKIVANQNAPALPPPAHTDRPVDDVDSFTAAVIAAAE